MPLETTRFDIQEYLKTPEQQVAYIEAALDEDDPAFLAKALGEVARARGMTQVAKDAGVTREALYRALSEKGDPRLSTLMGVMKALGLKLRIAA
ncbi:addiction module antidote protein [Bosea sp. BIWAKO-01]|uniref:addiction module antidote protein n=1 Tax=Bosea sp. BIWAKO-01 TaxID=506668 RepID=UPI000853AE61|nr:addiction module antidote protein [Bosea sp. BIWAKO-01]GAU86002.1 hypothetical protein BIWAKO_05950 [Bosea sp. BIWAKO-01]